MSKPDEISPQAILAKFQEAKRELLKKGVPENLLATKLSDGETEKLKKLTEKYRANFKVFQETKELLLKTGSPFKQK